MLASGAMDAATQKLTDFMLGWLGQQLQHPVAADAELASLGLDSIDMVRLADAVAEHLGMDDLPVAVLLDHASVGAAAAHVAKLKNQ